MRTIAANVCLLLAALCGLAFVWATGASPDSHEQGAAVPLCVALVLVAAAGAFEFNGRAEQ